MDLNSTGDELDELTGSTESARQTTTLSFEKFFFSLKSDAKPSNIKNLCEEAIKNGHEECVWLCFSRRSCFFARDIPIREEGTGLEIHNLRNRCGWWKRISLRSAVDIQEVKMHVIRTQSAQELEVMVIPVNHSPEMANIERILQDWSPAETMCDAGYKNDGSFQHCSAPTSCPNTVMYDSDSYPEWYCSQERHHQLRAQLRNLQYRQPMLNFYWNSRGKSDCQQFLRESGLVTQYRNLTTYHFLDAGVHYGDSIPGESIPALLLVDGWNISRLLILIGLAALTAIIVTVIGTAVGQNISTGLTAGSYAFGVVAVLIATLTFFSAIL